MSPPAYIPDEKDNYLTVVRQYWPGVTDDEAESLLWETTCFPFGSMEQVAQQLATSFALTNGNVTMAIDNAYAEIARAMDEYHKKYDGVDL